LSENEHISLRGAERLKHDSGILADDIGASFEATSLVEIFNDTYSISVTFSHHDENGTTSDTKPETEELLAAEKTKDITQKQRKKKILKTLNTNQMNKTKILKKEKSFVKQKEEEESPRKESTPRIENAIQIETDTEEQRKDENGNLKEDTETYIDRIRKEQTKKRRKNKRTKLKTIPENEKHSGTKKRTTRRRSKKAKISNTGELYDFERRFSFCDQPNIDYTKGVFHDQADAERIVIRRPLRGHNNTPFGRPTPGRPIGHPYRGPEG
jgi:hypothetical protein